MTIELAARYVEHDGDVDLIVTQTYYPGWTCSSTVGRDGVDPVDGDSRGSGWRARVPAMLN